MSKIFIEREKATRKPVKTGETLARFLDRMKSENACDADLSWEELAIYNWGTREPKEVNRSLIELIGSDDQVDDVDPQNTVLDTDFGLGQEILVPRAWKKEGLELEKTHKVKIRKRLPVPAISFTKLSQWFIPETEDCQIEVSTEGVAARADKVDLEVQATRYFERNPGGELIPATPHTDVAWYEKISHPANPSFERDLQMLNFWKGESWPTDGILAWGSAGSYINSACAPYTVLARYYKDPKDRTAKINLEPFHPCWHRGAGGSLELDDDSLVVKWTIKDDGGKLKLGQLLIWDKDDKVVFNTVLSGDALDKGEYDLLNEKVIWDESDIEQDAMPYRVQIQAHSDMDEDNGLALAVMHTQVKSFQYDWVQCIAFDIRPGTKTVPPSSSPPVVARTYLGDTDDDVDIDARCEIMKEAIEIAYGNADVDPDPAVLKIFMAPEFYFRGANGAYKLEKISGIMDKLRLETDKIQYADWLFVFGTAIGYLKHEQETGSGVEEQRHAIRITAVDNSDPSFSRIKVQSKVCARIPKTVDAGAGSIQWKVKQPPSAQKNIVECIAESAQVYWLKLDAKGKFTIGVAELLEPITTEVFNVALVQKGWPAKSPCDENGLKAAIIYKEKVSSIDFIGPYSDDINKWFDEGGVGRKIQIHGATDRTVLPTEGAADLLGASPNLPTKTVKKTNRFGVERTVGSEINKSGEGGGSVFTIDGITFGLEVCLDHGYSRLWNFYQTNPTGDPKVQIHLIPSWGMEIGHGKVACLKKGVVFNVDGRRSDSVARVFDGMWSCDVHEDVAESARGKCPDSATICDSDYARWFADCHGYSHPVSFNCPKCGTAAVQHDLKLIGTKIKFLSDEPVPKASNPDYFATKGYVRVYKPKRIPDPEVV